MSDQWIILGVGDCINLAYVAKVMWGGDFPSADAAKKNRLYVFHGGVPQVTGQKGSISAYNYDSETKAKAARDTILKYLVNNGAIDMRPISEAGAATVNTGTVPEVTFTSYSADPEGATPGTASTDGSTVTITGAGFDARQAGYLVDGTNIIPVTYLSSTTIQVAMPAYAASTVTFDYQYTDNNGLAQTLSAAISITFEAP